MKIKICGLTNLEDAVHAIECGADALGFNLFPGSRRYVEVESAAHWLRQLPASTPKVAVLVNPSLSEATGIAQLGLFDNLQLHGDESAELCEQLARRKISFIKALPMVDKESAQQPTNFSTAEVLLDSLSAAGFGGTGQSFPWSLARRFVERHPELRVILAGGLTPENVGEAIASARPYGVDVTSGVEAGIGRKDRAHLTAFIAAARRV